MRNGLDSRSTLLLVGMIALSTWVIAVGEEACLSNGASYAYYAGPKLMGIGATMIAATVGLFVFFSRRLNNPTQRLLLVLPIPSKLPLATALVLMSNGDGKVYQYVMEHGGEKIFEHAYADREETETRVTYLGKPIYDPYHQRFIIDGWEYQSKTIIVHEQPPSRL